MLERERDEYAVGILFVFGVVTIVFGALLSKTFWTILLALVLLAAAGAVVWSIYQLTIRRWLRRRPR